MLIDAKKLWVEGGYSQNNPYEVFISRVRQHAESINLSSEELDLVLVDFFIDLRKDPMMYRTEGNVCLQCNCEITNSGTNATHYIFRKIDELKRITVKEQQELFTKALNQKLLDYIEADNAKYTELYGPNRASYWYEMPTFKRWAKIIFRINNDGI